MEKEFCTAIVLAGGQGKRMGTKIQKQYLEVQGKPILFYSLEVFQKSPLIDEIILVVGEGQEAYCREHITDKYHMDKVRHYVQGGKERYHSVWNALKEARTDGYVFVHDGARPFVNEEIIRRVYTQVKKDKACVVAMPVKDTIKQADSNEYVAGTPDRSTLWMVQTPQVFDMKLLQGAYSMLMRESYINVTDDAMVVESMLGHPVKFVRGSYENIKITTPEDLEIAEVFAARCKNT